MASTQFTELTERLEGELVEAQATLGGLRAELDALHLPAELGAGDAVKRRVKVRQEIAAAEELIESKRAALDAAKPFVAREFQEALAEIKEETAVEVGEILARRDALARKAQGAFDALVRLVKEVDTLGTEARTLWSRFAQGDHARSVGGSSIAPVVLGGLVAARLADERALPADFLSPGSVPSIVDAAASGNRGFERVEALDVAA